MATNNIIQYPESVLSNRTYRYVHDPQYQTFDNHLGRTKKLNFNRCGDTFKPEYIVVEQTEPEININKIEIFISNIKIFEIDVAFMSQIYPDMIKFKNNKTIYKLYMDKWFVDNDGYISMINIINSITMMVHFTNDNVSSAKVMTDYIYLDDSVRTQLGQSDYYGKIVQYESSVFNVNGTHTNIPIYHHGHINGLFIETDTSIDNIAHLEIIAYGMIMKSFDDLQLEYMMKKFNNNMFYLPFNNVDFFDVHNTNGALNLNRYDMITLKLYGNNSFNKIKIYTLSANVIKSHHNALNIYLLHNDTHDITYNNTHDSNDTHDITYNDTHDSNNTHNISSSTKINKIYTGDEPCIISLNDIVPGTEYKECNNCNKAFINQYITEWLNNNNSCPHCRTIWQSNNIYINQD